MFDESVLTPEEAAAYKLRVLYKQYGYEPFRMRKFEEYGLYLKNKDFLVSDQVITFNDTNGQLLALKPDVTISIIKQTEVVPGEVQRVFYNESVYRVSPTTQRYKEVTQTGLECIGSIGVADIFEVISLAAKSLSLLADSYVLQIGNLDLVNKAVGLACSNEEFREEAFGLINARNTDELVRLCTKYGISETAQKPLLVLLGAYGKGSAVLAQLRTVFSETDLEELSDIVALLEQSDFADNVVFDFSLINNTKYYNGFIFSGFLAGVSECVLTGGQYNNMMEKMGKPAGAIGLAVYLDEIERADQTKQVNLLKQTKQGREDGAVLDKNAAVKQNQEMVNVALPKGRLGEQVYNLLEQAGYNCDELLDPGRKLIFENTAAGVRYFWVKPSDVAIYVERGAADVGIVGKDILLESSPNVNELLDLGLGKCKMCVAGPVGVNADPNCTLRVATKFSNIAQDYYNEVGRDIDIIKLNGSIEVAPLLGLSDVIVDIVETGNTIRANNLEVKAEIMDISARFVANKSAYQFKNQAITAMLEKLQAEL